MPSRLDSSFRDPSGFMYESEGQYYRVVTDFYRETYNQFKESGLADTLVETGELIPFSEVECDEQWDDVNVYKVLHPEQLKHVSYPYEWCFSQLKDAALLTLDIQSKALEHGMCLKDASAYNIQFHQGRPVFIDTLSFESYQEGMPWIAYQQFCQHFLAPLVLAAYVDVMNLKLSRLFIDGVPMNYAVHQLPLRAKIRPSIFAHLVLHARAQQSHSDDKRIKERKVSKNAVIGLVDNLRVLVNSLQWNKTDTEWGDYYADTNYSDASAQEKHRIIERILRDVQPGLVWDMGGNTGEYSRIASQQGIETVSFDVDYGAIEHSYRQTLNSGEDNISQFVMDLTNPSCGTGWNNQERDALANRTTADLVMALALIHHLCISNHLPLEQVANFFYRYTRKHLVIEFVPKSDSQVIRLLSTREDIFDRYTQEQFEKVFSIVFDCIKKVPVPGTERTIYFMERRQ